MSASTDPERSLKTAASLLLLKAGFLLVGPVVVLTLAWSDIDELGRKLVVIPIVLGLYVLAVALLLRKRRRVGRILAWLVLPVFALGFPLGTILSVATMLKLEDGKAALR